MAKIIWTNICSLRTQNPTNQMHHGLDKQSIAGALFLLPSPNFTGISNIWAIRLYLNSWKRRKLFFPLPSSFPHCLLLYFLNFSLNNTHLKSLPWFSERFSEHHPVSCCWRRAFSPGLPRPHCGLYVSEELISVTWGKWHLSIYFCLSRN